MNIEQVVVREVRVRGTSSGMDQVARDYGKVAAAADSTAASFGKSSREAAVAEAAINKVGQQLQDNFRQQQQYIDMLARQSQAQQQAVAANDNASKSFSGAGVEIASAANHLRQAGEAAYAFSPAFRGVVNAMAVPVLKAAGGALEAVAVGMVTATNLAGTGLIRLSASATAAGPAFAPLSAGLKSVGTSLEAFSPSVAGVASSILTRLLPALRLLGPAMLIFDGIKLVAEAWQLGAAKLAEYADIAKKAAAIDLSTDFFQRITKGATDAKLPVDALTGAFTRLIQVSTEKLGGSDLQNRLDALTKAGNFSGNSGVGQLAAANTTEEKFRAIVSLVDQAMMKGERLAALDLAGTALGPGIAENLRKDSDYLTNMLAAADQISQTELVSNEDVARALDLQNRYDASVKILEQRWHPVQDLLTQAGIKMHETWVGIVEVIARAVDGVVKLAQKLADALSPFMEYLKTAARIVATGAAAVAPALGPPGAVIGIGANWAKDALGPSAPEVDAKTAAINRLRAGLQNVNAVQQAGAQINSIQNKIWADTSHAIKTVTEEANDAVDKAINTLRRHIEQQKADTLAVGLGDGALAGFRAQAAETAAVQANGGKETAEQAAQFKKLREEAVQTADSLARVKVASSIDFSNKTKFLSADDVAIASQLKGIYGNDVPAALASTEAAQIRVVNAQKLLSDGFQDVGKSMLSAFLSGKNVMDAMVQSLDNLAKKLSDKAFENILGSILTGDPVQAVVGIAQAGASALITAFTGDQKAKKELEDAKAAWAKMGDQVIAFNRAAAGFTLGPLTSQLQSLYSTFGELQLAAGKAHDTAAGQQQVATLYSGINRILATFEAGTQKLSPLQAAIKGVNDEAEGLKETLDQIGQGHYTYGATIDASAQAQIKALIEQFTQALTTSLTQRLNAANGKSYLNDAASLLTQHAADLATAAELGNSPALLSQISAVFAAEAQKIVEDAGLVGDGFSDFIKQFPQFADVVTQSATALQAANDKFAALTKTINDYLDSLQIGSNSILSPQDQLGAAQGQFNAQLALAQQGNADALGSITKYASTLLDQAKSLYASSGGYGDVYNQVTAALRSLTSGAQAPGFANGGIIGNGAYNIDSVVARYADGGAVSLAGGEHVTRATSVTAGTYPVLDFINRNGAVPGNDNGQHFQALGSQLVRAMAGISAGELSAMREDSAALCALLRKLIKTVEDGKEKPGRPASRVAS